MKAREVALQKKQDELAVKTRRAADTIKAAGFVKGVSAAIDEVKLVSELALSAVNSYDSDTDKAKRDLDDVAKALSLLR